MVQRDDETILARSAALLSVFDHVPDVFVFVKNARREFVAVTQPFVTLMGCESAAELLGKRDEELSPEYLVVHYRDYDEAILRTGDPLVDLVELVRNRDGSYDWFISTKSAIRDETSRVIGIMGVTRSLTNRDPAAVRLLSLTPAVELISREFARPIKVEELAALVLMSPSHFNRLFKQHFATTPYKYLMRVRLMAACDLLATTTLPVSAISSRTGFYDASHLTNEFRREHGMSPNEYRSRFRTGPSYRTERLPMVGTEAATAPPAPLAAL
ncbi:AraC family transcriptional regulator [Herbiconiux sp. KACC 21604]|uniref:AraC family transcriptional regulator n=1 Tax=unclassified Herbiconiux TaxID=2618217 RepID=UPI00149278BA|nr:AraC family transcriptional regulator [Herbiconiux sp. SALV-R1]QJU55240.1 AraC family transcriptional regulator [Herbiconiux sp. SALV-R1]WPO86406.1 AraC family transcriptional regulator [Herbiconiux sp. KACC 21604]